MRPLLAVLGVAAAGLLLLVAGQWRLGAAVVGLALSLAGAVRLALPPERLGDLVVRSRFVDAAVMITLGFAVVGLANTIPGH